MISYLQIEGLTKSFGNALLLEDVSLGMAQGEKIGLIAPNGSGKTTLLNIIAGKEDYDSGRLVFRKDLRTGYLEQSPAFPAGLSVMQAMQAEGNELKAKQLLTQLNLTNPEQKTGELSGGQLKRLALARVLARDPELLLLDEPTNHLDLEMTEWLEAYLGRRNICILMVTHDRYFLDRVCTEIVEIDQRRLFRYKGAYSYFLEKRQERIEARNAETERANNLLRKELEWIRRQPQARATKAKYRVEAFGELEKKAGQRQDTKTVNLSVKASYVGSKIFEARGVSKRFGQLRIVEDFNYVFARYEKMGIIGNNGAGKSTFIRMLTGEIEPDSGCFEVGETVRFGYYSQEGIAYDEQARVIDLVQDIAEFVDMGDGRKLSVSQFLNHFLFPPEKQRDFVSRLSGGEKRRLYLCTTLMRNPNFLLLDEPTNDLDILTLNLLEEYLCRFKGCVIVVSHDRYFMDKVVDHLLVFRGDADVKDFPGNYTRYRRWKEEQEQAIRENETPRREKAEATPRRNLAAKPSRKPSFNACREIESLEAEIPRLEAEKSRLETSMSSGLLTNDELLAQARRIAELMDEIDAKTMRWLELSEPD